MTFGFASYGFALLAGVLSTLSPCVLPILPILFGSAVHAHPRAPLALSSGLALSYAVIGTALAWAGSALGVDTSIFRGMSAAVLGILGIVLMSTKLQQSFASVTSSIGDTGHNLTSRMRLDGLRGQFAIGLILGVAWSPCVGPTLGAAIVLASQGTNLLQAALLMGVFGMGAALPMVALAYASRSAILKMRGKLMQVSKISKAILGAAMAAVAAMILSGIDKPLEAWLVDHSPAWLTILTTRF